MVATEGHVAASTKVMVITADVDVRLQLAHALAEQRGIDVVGTAVNARTGAIKARSYGPEVFVVDVGREPSTALAAEALVPARCVGFAADAARAAASGFADVVAQPDPRDGPSFDAFVVELSRRIRGERARGRGGALSTEAAEAGAALPAARAAAPRTEVRPVEAPPERPRCLKPVPRVVGIGVSTGGPPALTTLLAKLPASFPLPILIVQHMPPNFTASLAESLDRVCPLRVREAQHGMPVRGGEVLIAPGGRQMRIVDTAQGVLVKVTDDPPECSCRPSVDYLFRSLGEVFGARTLAVVLTGMGEDGLAASRELARIGATLFAQDKATSTVFGMPRGLVEEKLADKVLPLDAMADAITARTLTLGAR